MQKVAGERYVYKFVCDPEALFTMAFPDNHRPFLKTEPPRDDFIMKDNAPNAETRVASATTALPPATTSPIHHIARHHQHVTFDMAPQTHISDHHHRFQYMRQMQCMYSSGPYMEGCVYWGIMGNLIPVYYLNVSSHSIVFHVVDRLTVFVSDIVVLFIEPIVYRHYYLCPPMYRLYHYCFSIQKLWILFIILIC